MLKNNGFQGDSPGLAAYKVIGDASISHDASTPLSSAITSSLKVSVPSNATGSSGGFANTGYGGVPVLATQYTSSFWIKGEYSGTVTLRLVGTSSGKIYASHDIGVSSVDSHFTYHEASFTSEASPDGDNEWQLVFDGSKVSGKSLNFVLVQLFPPTYHSR